MSTKELLDDALAETPIGSTAGFEWYATRIGIAALCKFSDPLQIEKLYQAAILEGLEIGLELTKEEREFHSCLKGIVIIFYS